MSTSWALAVSIKPSVRMHVTDKVLMIRKSMSNTHQHHCTALNGNLQSELSATGDQEVIFCCWQLDEIRTGR
jgi:hypothetical protein